MCLSPSDVTVVIPVVNEAGNLKACIESACNAGAIHVVVVDGGRGDTLLFVAARILSCTTGIQWSRPCSNRDLSARGSRLEWPLLVSVNLRVSTRRCCSYPAWRLVSCNNTVVLLPHRTR